MRIFKATYKARDGRTKKTAKWYVELRDHLATVRRFVGFTDKRQTEALGRQIDRLVRCRSVGERPDGDLAKWLEQIQPSLQDRFVAIGLLNGTQAAASKSLLQHLKDFENSLQAKGRTEQYIRETVRQIEQVFRGCRFVSWSDISASRIEGFLSGLRDGGSGISHRTFNAKLKAVKAFANWMVRDRRAVENPVVHLTCLNTEMDRRRERRSLEPDEVRRLLEATQAAGKRFGMGGNERALCYRLAIESGLRANEIRNLTVMSFDFTACTVTVRTGSAKNRQEATLPLRESMAVELSHFLAGKMPRCQAFNMPGKDRVAMMLRADLKDAEIPYRDMAGRYADFHCLRHTTASLLADAGVHPRVAQAILRHSDANMTLRTYTHVLRGRESEAVGKLPDFSLHAQQHQKATGTEGHADVTTGARLASCLACSWGKQRILVDDNRQTHRCVDSTETAQKSHFRPRNADSAPSRPIQRETGERGFEPRLTDPESVVLPLHYSPKSHLSPRW